MDELGFKQCWDQYIGECMVSVIYIKIMIPTNLPMGIRIVAKGDKNLDCSTDIHNHVRNDRRRNRFRDRNQAKRLI